MADIKVSVSSMEPVIPSKKIEVYRYMGMVKAVTLVQMILGAASLGSGVTTLIMTKPVYQFPISSGVSIWVGVMVFAAGYTGFRVCKLDENSGCFISRLWGYTNFSNGILGLCIMGLSWMIWAAIACAGVQQSPTEDNPMCAYEHKARVTALCAVDSVLLFFMTVCSVFSTVHLCYSAKRLGLRPERSC